MIGGLVTLLAGHFIETAKLKAYAIAFYVGAAASLLFAFVFALVGLRHWIAVTYLSQYPELWIALGFVVIAAVAIGVGVYWQKQKPKTNPAVDIALFAGPPTARLAVRTLSPRVVAVGVVLVAGLLLGRRMTGGRRATP